MGTSVWIGIAQISDRKKYVIVRFRRFEISNQLHLCLDILRKNASIPDSGLIVRFSNASCD